MTRKRQKTVVVDIPTELLDGDRPRTVMFENIKEALRNGLEHLFDATGKFNGIYINFKMPVFPADGKRRLNDCKRLTFTVDSGTYDLLSRAKCYTSMSLKNIAEVVILKELLGAEGGENNAKDGSVHNWQGDAADG